jgi:capsular polysaccharide biosynthesis protein
VENHQQVIQNDVIDLRELFAVLKRRKKLIWFITAVLTLLAMIYVFFIAKPVYEVRTMIEIGQIDAKPIDNLNDIKQKLSYEYQVNSKGKKRSLPFVKNITASKSSQTILSLTVYASNNEEGKQYIQSVITKIETDYKKKTDAYTRSQKESIQLIQQDIEENKLNLIQIKKELNNYKQKIISLKSEDAALAGIYALQIGQQQTQLVELQKYISELKNKREELKLSITPLMIKPTHIVGEVETLEHPIQPKKKLIVIVAFITGLMLSVFLAFFLEFLAGSKEEVQ